MKLVDPRVLKDHPSHLIPDMRPNEWQDFYTDISLRGIKVPLEILADGTVLDGKHRLRAAIQLGMIEVPVVDAPLNDDSPEAYMLKAAVLRRHLTDDQRAIIAALWKEENKKQGERTDLTSPPRCGEVKQSHPTQAKTQELFKVSKQKLDRATYVQKRDPDLANKVHRGDIALSNAYRQVKAPEERQKIEATKPPEGTYQVIVIDPPWPFNSRQSDPTHEIASPYEIKSIIEIKALNIPAAEDSVLWLWVPNAFLHDAFHVLEAWGFSYKTTLTWVKDKIGLGDWQTEHCLVGVKGDYRLIPGNNSTALFADSTQHSAKPDSFYELVTQLCPGTKIDVFGRKKRDGWVIWGPDSENNNQVNWHKVAKVRNLRAMRVAVVNSSYYGMKPGDRIYNLGSDKIAQYHRLRGDDVVYAGPWVPMMPENRAADKVYFSVLFTWDIPEMIRQVQMVRDWGKEVEIGGPAATFMHKYIHTQTGIEPHCGLDERFEHIPPLSWLKNYRPNMTGGDYKLTFSQRGCPHHCAFCGVKKVEPDLLEYDDFPMAPMIGDNNILATSWEHQELVLNRFVNFGREIDINSGFDVRFFQEEHFKLFSRLRLKYWRFAWDTMEVEDDVRRVAAMMRNNGLDRHQVTVYALIGFPGQTVEECLYRLNTLIGLGLNPYPMRFWPLNSLDRKYVAPDWNEYLLQRMTAYFQTPFLWMSDSWENYRQGQRDRR